MSGEALAGAAALGAAWLLAGRAADGPPEKSAGDPLAAENAMPYPPKPPPSSGLVYPLAGGRIQARYTTRRPGRRPTLIVLHSTDGKAIKATATANYFAEMSDGRRCSAHYVVGRDGGVVECADPDNEDAWHAHGVNASSVGIEHQGSDVAPLTPAQYSASADLVAFLCSRYGIPFDRRHVVGHAEADPTTTHTRCPISSLSWGAWEVAAGPLGFRR